MKKILVTLVVTLTTVCTLFAAPARRNLIPHAQPDGSTITIRLNGDEHFHYYTTADGVMIQKGGDGGFYYAELTEDGVLISSSQLAHNMEDRNTSELDYSNQIKSEAKDKVAMISSERKNAKGAETQAYEMPLARRLVQNTNIDDNKKFRLPVILVQFQDVKFSETDPKSAFNRRMNEVNFKEDSYYGSVRDYFENQSSGILVPSIDVIGPITTNYNMEYYGKDGIGNNHDLKAREMVREVCKKAFDLGTDFSVYDNDGDEVVDMVYIIYAGYGQNYGGSDPNTIWPHQHNVGSNFILGNIELYTYACSNERRGIDKNRDGGIEGPGVLCHEFSHCLGLPDFYDTSDEGNFGMDVWSLMDSGCYNNDGFTPCGYTAYELEFLGWPVEIETLDSPSSITLEALNVSRKAYRIENDASIAMSGTNAAKREYFILENRQQTGWDSNMYAHGLMISHVDYNKTAWERNIVNTIAKHQRMTIVPADNDTVSVNDSRESVKGDLYPGPNNNTSFTNNSFPAASVYTNKYTDFLNKPVTNIKETNGIITFDFMGGSVSVEENIIAETFTVRTANNEIIVNAQEGKQFYIYSIDGILKHSFISKEGENNITLNSGIYIIKSDNQSVKTIISTK